MYQIVGLGFCSKSLTFVNFEVRIPLFIYCSVKECLFANTELNKIIILKCVHSLLLYTIRLFNLTIKFLKVWKELWNHVGKVLKK